MFTSQWNKLPNTTVSIKTIESFDHRLDSYVDESGWV